MIIKVMNPQKNWETLLMILRKNFLKVGNMKKKLTGHLDVIDQKL